MRSRRFWLWGLSTLVLAGAAPSVPTDAPPPARRDDRDLVALIDGLVAARWAEAKVKPAATADDAEFLRRVTLDLTGKIPSVAETRAFLDDARPDKRARLVDRLLDSPAHINHMTIVWRDLLLPEAGSDLVVRYLAPDFEAWLRQKVVDNVGYDVIARDLVALSLEGENGRRGVNPFERKAGDPTPLAYYMAKEGKPENLAAATARTFLGIRIECAQCHDHPFARWKRDQFWSYAAFFGGIQQTGSNEEFSPVREIPDRRELAIPGTDRVVQASFLDGSEPQWKFKVGSRVTLAEWMTAGENPYFARAGVNRLWAHLFGTGLVDPVDDLSDANPPSNPELLDELARQFARRKYDVKFLLRVLTATRAYQLTSDVEDSSQNDPHLFARMPVRGLSAAQLLASLNQATGRREEPAEASELFDEGSIRSEILRKFDRHDERPTETETTILQALALMNGKFTAEATDPSQGPTLAAIAEAPFLATADKIEALYLATLSRKPRPEELSRLVEYVRLRSAEAKRHGPLERLGARLLTLVKLNAPAPVADKVPGPSDGTGAALADVFWSLLNSSEFMLNH